MSCEPSLVAVILILPFFSFFLFFFCLLLCLFVFFFVFRADTSLFLFNLIFDNLILHLFRIIIIIIRCSGMFRNFPCSGFFRRPVLDLLYPPSTEPKSEVAQTSQNKCENHTSFACYKLFPSCFHLYS